MDIRRELAQTVVSHGWGLLEMRAIRMSLEDIFLQLTTTEEDSIEERTAAPGKDDGGTP